MARIGKVMIAAGWAFSWTAWAADPADMVGGIFGVEEIRVLDEANVLIAVADGSGNGRIAVDCIGATWGFEQENERIAVMPDSQAHATAYRACLGTPYKHSLLKSPGTWGAVAPRAMSRPLRVPSDSKARYTVLEIAGTYHLRTIVTRREGSSGTSYSRRLYDCASDTVTYLGTGDSPEAMRTSRANPRMGPVGEGGIAYYVGIEACR